MTTTTTGASHPEVSPFFTDARGCREWLNSLALANAAQAASTLLDALRVFNRGTAEPLERLKCLELMRDKIAFVLTEHRSRIASKTVPLGGQDAEAWSAGRALLEEMEAGYRRALGESELQPHAPLIAQRLMRYLGAQMIHHALAYRRFEPVLWTRLHEHFAAAESAGIVSARVKDSLEGAEGVSSAMEVYAHAVLFQAAGPAQLSPAHIAFVDALLRGWSRKVRVVAGELPGDGTALAPWMVDLARAEGPVPHQGSEMGSQHRMLELGALARSIRRRVRALQNGEDAATLNLPAEVTGVEPLQALQRLNRLWCEARPGVADGHAPRVASAGIVFGLANIHFFASGGKAFEAPGKERELSRQEKDDIAVFGRVTQRTQSMMLPAQQQVTLEKWTVLEETPRAWRLERPAGSSKGVSVGRLAGIRTGDEGEPLAAGVVSALVEEGDGRWIVEITVFPGRPQPVAVSDGRRANAPWTPGLYLPAQESIRMPAMLVLPNGMAFRGRSVLCWQDGPAECTVHEIADRGTDFDRVTVKT